MVVHLHKSHCYANLVFPGVSGTGYAHTRKGSVVRIHYQNQHCQQAWISSSNVKPEQLVPFPRNYNISASSFTPNGHALHKRSTPSCQTRQRNWPTSRLPPQRARPENLKRRTRTSALRRRRSPPPPRRLTRTPRSCERNARRRRSWCL